MNTVFSPKTQIVFSWVVLIGSVLGWPLSALTVASAEPQGILGLSWFAIILGAFNTLVTTSVNKEVSVTADTANVEADQVHINREGENDDA